VPLLKITTTATPAETERAMLLRELSSLIATRLDKPQAYVMTALEPGVLMTFGGTTDPACYVEVKNIGGFTPDLTSKLSAELCDRLSRALEVPKNRIYLEFTSSEGYLWGHDGETFA
jgi:hypothetical protein